MSESVGGPGPSFLESLGDRCLRRAEPRTSVSLAGAGCALGVLGVLVLSGDTGIDDATGELNRVPGLLLSALVVASGYYLLAIVRRGPLAAAGTVAAALGVPAFLFFATFDETAVPPFETEVILVATTAAWVVSHVVGPGKGRPFFLGAGLLAFWLTVLELTENVFESPWDVGGWLFGATFTVEDELGTAGSFGEPIPQRPDLTTIGLLSLILAVAFLLVGRWLDREGRAGSATPFTFAALPCLAVGSLSLAPDLEESTGLLLLVIGLALAYHGGTVVRRATSWIGGATAAVGLAFFLGDNAGDSVTTAAMLFIAGGIGMVFLGHLVATATNEPDELAVTVLPVPAPARQIVAPAPPSPEADPEPEPPADPDAPFRPPVPPSADDAPPPPP
jgi:hypothetical protein